ncbi:MAG TPA: putative Ig domain-containing protein [Acidimicrobiales bacterium]|nr:putative Ig domain-containing protein [Acidimicrobiales bacterium]
MPGAGAQTPPVITSAPPPQGTVGMSYLHQFTSSPQTSDPTFSVTSGALPSGLSLSPEGFLSGSADAAGTFGPTTVCASNGAGTPACQTFTITIQERVDELLTPGG